MRTGPRGIFDREREGGFRSVARATDRLDVVLCEECGSGAAPEVAVGVAVGVRIAEHVVVVLHLTAAESAGGPVCQSA